MIDDHEHDGERAKEIEARLARPRTEAWINRRKSLGHGVEVKEGATKLVHSKR